nr:cytochrome p450 [Quercus suber]
MHFLLKGMVNLMVDPTFSMLRSWESRLENEGGIADIEIIEDFRSLSEYIISRACFGSNYSQGEEIFLKLKALQGIMSKGNIGVPGFRFQSQYCNSTMMWGPDAHKFNPKRFAHGIVWACKTPQAYMPFGVGSRVCAGQHFAMTELKVILSLILSKFCFSLSPAYQHSPAFRLVIVPEHGVILRVRTA